ncbi:hypothetical protein Aperf_G00000102451 [Anoplocephala perfoliata]
MEAVEAWLNDETAVCNLTKDWQDFTQRARDFVKRCGPSFRIVCVTSGGTTVPLEKNTVRFIDNFRLQTEDQKCSLPLRRTLSASNICTNYPFTDMFNKQPAMPLAFQGPRYQVVLLTVAIYANLIAEQLPLRREYEVHNSMIPFTNRCCSPGGPSSTTLDAWIDLEAISKSNPSDPPKLNPTFAHRITEAARSYVQFKDQLFLTDFTTVEEYLVKLRWLCSLLSQEDFCPRGSLLYLAAAVSDFYVPRKALPQHKLHGPELEKGDTGDTSICDSNGSLTIHLEPVPKVLGLIVSKWAPGTMVVSFKLETDKNLVLKWAKASMKRYGTHAVIANLLHTRKREAWLFHNLGGGGEEPQYVSITQLPPKSSSTQLTSTPELEEILTQKVADLHSLFMKHRKQTQ